jgi:hypothetical protein
MTDTLPLTGGTGTKKWTLADGISECKREMHMRARVYPNLIARGQLTEQDANKQNVALHGTLIFLQFCAKHELRLRQVLAEGEEV